MTLRSDLEKLRDARNTLLVDLEVAFRRDWRYPATLLVVGWILFTLGWVALGRL